MAYKQTQKISGAASNSGKSVAIKGYYAITADDGGDVYTYKKQTDGEWIEVGAYSTASSSYGDSLDIGSKYYVLGGPDSGAGIAVVVDLNDPTVALTSFSGVVAGDKFGSAVAISDDYILVGASNADSSRGDAYLYIKGSGATWTAYSGNPITPTYRTANDLFGCSVAISGDTLIIGAEGDNTKTGAVYIFDKNEETGLWEETQKILASDGNYNDQFGESVSADGEYFVAGASLAESVAGEVNSGAAYVFKYGTSWSEVDKLTSVDESIPSQDHFGESVDLNGDYIIVGSPTARSKGVADIFYKKRSWDHLIKIVGSDSLTDDAFGSSVAISGKNIIVGSPSEGANGSIYYYEDTPVRLRLAQEFDIERDYIPSKASVYLKRSGRNTYNYFLIDDTTKTVIDATNFSSITSLANNPDKIIFSEETEGFTGNGYMTNNEVTSSNGYEVVNYPVKSIVSGTYKLWMRVININSYNLNIEVLIDGNISKTISSIVGNPSDGAEWTWISSDLVLPDIAVHTLGIKIKDNGGAIDKLYIDASDDIPYFEGPDYVESPYVTVHMKVYGGENETYPKTQISTYDYKTTIDEIIQDDWYNFNINVFSNSPQYDYSSFDPSSIIYDNYFLVLTSSGGSYSNYVLWEMLDSDEYTGGVSAITISPGLDSLNIDLTPLDYYKAKAGESDLDSGKWYINYNKIYAFKIYSDYDPIEEV